MDNIIVIGLIIIILGAAIGYIVKAKKRGVKCIGCPNGSKCASETASKCNGQCSGCSCGCPANNQDNNNNY